MDSGRSRRGKLTLEEIKRLQQKAPPLPPPRTLSPTELEDLRERLNRGQDPRDLNEQNASYTLGIVRHEHLVENLYQRVCRKVLDAPPESTTRPYAQGILDALAWARGEQRQGPLSGHIEETERPPTRALEKEASTGSRMLTGEMTRPPGLSTSYIVGVQSTLLWLVCQGPDPWD